jgi:hypothetical protein
MRARGMAEDPAFVIVEAVKRARKEVPEIDSGTKWDPTEELLNDYKFGKAIIAALDMVGYNLTPKQTESDA